ncbi:MAG: HAMP domain-containing histidine kinase, partial [Muribaculaceae bacterium]|nr:HAMP domain-containing histidine kinase [Muribaculaceae bacterium]
LIVCLILQVATVLKLSRLDKMRSSFITTMIHELKRPISTLKMCVSGIENDRMIADRETKEELVSETRGALDNLSAYFSKLRDMTFNNVEQIPLNLANVNLRHIVDMVFKGAVIPSDKDVSMLNEIGEDVEVPADFSHLFNILTNLVENAIKYSGDEVEIKAAAKMLEDGVAIKISDNGFGISQGESKHIFQRFYRGSKHSGSLPGMGLGLAYVKLLVEAHHGEILVESEEGKGSSFTIKLPY